MRALHAIQVDVPTELADTLLTRPGIHVSQICRGALRAAIDPSDLAEAISAAIDNVNEGHPLTAKQWEYVAHSVLSHLNETGEL